MSGTRSPLFLLRYLEDSQEFLDIYQQQYPDLAASLRIEVDSLENYITSFETADHLFVNLFSLVP